MYAEKNTSRESQIYKVTIVGSVVNFVLIVFKLLAGIFANSAAMIADAIHSVSDFLTDVVVLYFVKVSSSPKDKDHNYGHGKFETTAVLVIGLTLMFVAFGIAWSAVSSITKVLSGGELQSPRLLAFIAALVSIIFKEALYWYTYINGRKLNSDSVVANAAHHRSDAFSSVATALGIGGAILFGGEWAILDPIAALIVSVFIGYIAFKFLKGSFQELMETSLPDEVVNEIIKIACGIEKIAQPHNLRTRKIGHYCAIEMHVRLDPNMTISEAHEIVTTLEEKLKSMYGANTHVIIHMEPMKDGGFDACVIK